MANEITITNVNTGNLTRFEDVNNSLQSLAIAVNTSIYTEKDIAKAFEELRTTPNFSNAFHNTKFQVVAETFTEGRYKGATAYKYAQCYKIFGNKSHIWDAFTMGKMIILSPLVSDKNAKLGITIDGFFASIGNKVVQSQINVWEQWNDETSAIKSKAEKLRSVGLDDMANDIEKNIATEPAIIGAIRYLKEDGTIEWEINPDYSLEIGEKFAIQFKDKQLKEAVSEYINSIRPKKEKTESEETGQDGTKAEKTIAELKADALAAMMAYTEKLDTIPKALNNAIKELSKEDTAE